MADFTDAGPSSNVAQNQVVSKLAPPSFSTSNVVTDATSSTGLSTLGSSTLFNTAAASAAASARTTAGISNLVTTNPLSDTTTAAVGAQILGDASNASWQPNVLSDIEQSTYNIRFFMTQDTPIPFSTMKSWSDAKAAIAKLKSTTIAQSGVTGLAVESLQIKSIPAPNQVTRAVAATALTLVIKEPMGVSFFDMIAQSAQELGIKNFSKFFYYIEVTFKGYDTGGAFDYNPCQSFPNGGSWLYQVSITNIQVDANAAGSTYTISCIPAEEDLYNEIDLKLPGPFNPSGTTVGGMLDQLSKMLNDNNQALYGTNITTYGFKLAPFIVNSQQVDPTNWAITPAQITYSDERSMAMSTSEGVDQNTPVKGHFSKGTNITDVIEQIIISCPDAQKYAKDVQKDDVIDKDDKKTRNSIVFRFEPTLEISDYDPNVDQYVKLFTFNILSYFTTKPIVATSDVDAAKDATNQKEKVTTFTESGYMVKRYDYMFTGLNTEVLNFDFKYNFNWSAVLPYLQGYQGSVPSMTDQAQVRDDPQDLQALQRQIAALVSKKNSLNEQLQSLQDTLANDQKTNNAGSNDAKIAEEQGKISSITDSITRASNQLGSLQATRNPLATANKQQTLASYQNPSANPNRAQVAYAEDMLQNVAVPRFPTSIKQAPNSQGTGALPQNYTRDRSIYGAILDQLYGPVTADLQTISLVINGDPYWLGAGNLERAVGRSASISTPRDHFSKGVINNNQVDYTYGDIMFLLAFKYPLGVNDDGSPIFKFNESFTGIYRVAQVTHDFSGGMFKQTFEAARMALTDAFKALDFNANLQATPSTIAANQTISGQATK